MGGETYVDCGAGNSLGAGELLGARELLGAGRILTSKPFEASGWGLRVQSSAGRALQGGPVILDVSSDLSVVLAVVLGGIGDLPLQGDAPVEGPTL
jgi:hypothetical protein